jgi:hypothetical protein
MKEPTTATARFHRWGMTDVEPVEPAFVHCGHHVALRDQQRAVSNPWLLWGFGLLGVCAWINICSNAWIR